MLLYDPLSHVLTVFDGDQQLEFQEQITETKLHGSASQSGNNLLTLLSGYAMLCDFVSKLLERENCEQEKYRRRRLNVC
jgi:hypothetical protein